MKSPRFNPKAFTAASGSRPHALTFSFGAIMAAIDAVDGGVRCASTSAFDVSPRRCVRHPRRIQNVRSKSGSLIQINGQTWNLDLGKASRRCP
jgi:hypothetical protein